MKYKIGEIVEYCGPNKNWKQNKYTFRISDYNSFTDEFKLLVVREIAETQLASGYLSGEFIMLQSHKICKPKDRSNHPEWL